MSIADTTEAQFDQDTSGARAVLIDFWGTNCPPCKALMPHLDALDAKVGDHLRILKVNVEAEPALARRFQVRGVPTLVFLNDGKEEGRLVGTTTTRLNAMIGKWIGESKIGLLADALAQSAPEAKAAARTWSAFSGRVELREASVACIRNVAYSPGLRPSTLMAETPEQLDGELGVPATCARMLDFIWNESIAYKFASFEAVRETVADLVAAMPLGADLLAITRELRFEMLYRSQWAVAAYFDDKDTQSVLDDIRALHQREIDGETVSESQWESVKRRAVLLADIDGTRDAESRKLETLATPLASHGWDSGIYLVMGLYHDDERREPHWSAADRARMRALASEVETRIRETLRPLPASGCDELAARERQVVAIRTRWEADERAADPSLWTRHDDYLENVRATRGKMVAFLQTQLRSAFDVANAPIA